MFKKGDHQGRRPSWHEVTFQALYPLKVNSLHVLSTKSPFCTRMKSRLPVHRIHTFQIRQEVALVFEHHGILEEFALPTNHLE